MNKVFIGTILVLGFVVYLLTNKGIPGNIGSSASVIAPPFTGENSAFELSHERSSYATLVALDETGRTDLSYRLADAAAPDAGFYQGKYYSFFPPGLAFTGWPLYKLGQQFDLSLVFAYFTVALFGIAGLVLIYKICDEICRFPKWLSLFVSLSTGFASTYLNFSITFYQHVPSAALMLLAFYSAWRYGLRFKWYWAALSWACYGAASFFDYPNLILFIPVILYLVWQGVYKSDGGDSIKLGIRKSVILSAVVVLALGLAHMYYNHVNYGDWGKLSNTLPRFNPRALSGAVDELDPNIVEQIAAEKSDYTFALRETNLANGFFVLLLDFDKSLLIHMPIFLIAVLGFISVRNRLNKEVLTMAFIILANLLLYSSFFDPWGGWGFGPRYLVVSMPFISIFAGFWLADGRMYKRLVVLPFVVYSAGVALLGAVTKNFLVPKVEVLPLDLPYKIWSEFKYLKINQNGTFIYNTYLADIPLTSYFIALWVFVSLVLIFVLFALPYLTYADQNQQINNK